jgi:hypothetical protein
VVKALGGTVVGSVRHPPGTPDFSSYLLQAQASRSRIIGLANAAGDTINSVKQAAEFGIVQGGQRLAALLMQITDVHSIGLAAAQGLYLTEAFYWDMNDGTRRFSARFAEAAGDKRPTMMQAGVYASILHYLRGVKAAGTTEGTKVVAAMKTIPSDERSADHSGNTQTTAVQLWNPPNWPWARAIWPCVLQPAKSTSPSLPSRRATRVRRTAMKLSHGESLNSSGVPRPGGCPFPIRNLNHGYRCRTITRRDRPTRRALGSPLPGFRIC